MQNEEMKHFALIPFSRECQYVAAIMFSTWEA